MSHLPFASLLFASPTQMSSNPVPDEALRAAFEEAYLDAAALQEQMFEITEPDAFANISTHFVGSLVSPHSRVLA